jgi:phosphohistidine phosphatase
MRVILFRHGPAGSPDASRWPDDAERPLTSRGEERTQEAARGLARIEPGISRVFASPYRRATQTARLLCAALPGDPPLEELGFLTPGGSARGLLQHLAELDSGETVALVGHEPSLGKLAGTLILGAPAALPLKKAGACAVDFSGPPRGGEGRLRWFLPPKALRRLARDSGKP